MLIKYIKSVLWRAVKRLSYIQDVRCLKVKKGGICRARGMVGMLQVYVRI